MRQGKKSELYNVFNPAIQNSSLLSDCQFVIDGAWLLRQVCWPHGRTFLDIFQIYENYIQRNFRDAQVVFDGYKNDVIGVKTYERLRRKETSFAVDVDIGPDKMITVTKDKFLSNVVNKYKLVRLLSEHLNRKGIVTTVAAEDADALIIRTAIEMNDRRLLEDRPVVVVGNNVDLLVLLVGLTPDGDNIHFYKIVSIGKKDRKLYSTRDNKCFKSFILFAHAFSGCDSTSAVFNKGKKIIISLLSENKDLCDAVSIFYEGGSSAAQLYTVAEKMIKHWYVNNEQRNLPINELRFELFRTFVPGAKRDGLQSLPPTEAALLEHTKRVYFQVQQWLNYKLDPQDWGWERSMNDAVILIPTKSSLKAAPDDLLGKIGCKCVKSNCAKGRCVCKHAGLSCTKFCKHCSGSEDCINFETREDYPQEDIDENLESDNEKYGGEGERQEELEEVEVVEEEITRDEDFFEVDFDYY
ncbi:uncharacterized protein [Fopius arisanus]|uniref:Tesmin/TSO1-like CXC domain-containing protein n=1 Tax=Fopius arisanus TaxID=64838 RepID=A0A9R1UBN5_9HYME|nr:PREDICTED: uncharacterized protein LOC105273740 [Fopius arisanus]